MIVTMEDFPNNEQTPPSVFLMNYGISQPLCVVAYADFIEEFKDLIYGFITLDVIGDPEASRNNTEYLRSRDLDPIEVFHYDSDFSELERMISADHEVIALGGTVGKSEKQKRAFFHEIFKRFPDQNFHLLGCGSPLILEFNFFSSDSSTWLFGRKFKIILTPKQIKAPIGWTGDDCIAYNVMFQSQYESWYEKSVQLEFSLAC